MLSIIDRYIIKKFLWTFFFIFGVVMLLSVVFDLSEKFSDFLEKNATLGDILFKYYINFILHYGNLFSSMIIFIAVIFFTAKMAQNTEIIPIWNSGRNFSRYVRPYMIVATLLMMISLGLNHFVIPNSNKVRLDFEEKYYRNEMYVQDYLGEYPGNRVVSFDNYKAKTNKIENFTLQQLDEKGNVIYTLHARVAQNKIGTKQWHFTDYFERRIGFPMDIIHDGRSKDTLLDFEVTEMATRENVAEAMTYFELKEFIEKERAKGSAMVTTYEIELHQRTSYPFATYVLTIIGIAVSCKKRRGGIGASLAVGIFIVISYIFAMKITSVAAVNIGFPSLLAVWIPNLAFGILAYFMYKRAQV